MDDVRTKPLESQSRWCRKGGTILEVPQPMCIDEAVAYVVICLEEEKPDWGLPEVFFQ